MIKNAMIGLRFKSETADTFRRYARKLGKTQSETLQILLEGSEATGETSQDAGSEMKVLEQNLTKRINILMAIIRDIEKRQTKPMLAMLELLFQEAPVRRQELLLEKEVMKASPVQEKSLESGTGDMQRNMMISDLLSRVLPTRSTFGKNQLRIQMSPEEFDMWLSKFKQLS